LGDTATQTVEQTAFSSKQRFQRTLKDKASFTGVGLHTGSPVTVEFCPASAGTGIVFRRTDLEGCPEIEARVENVGETMRSTTIGQGNVMVTTVEHVIATLRAYQIDNVYVDISAAEPPVGNGSANIFVDMVEKAGIVELEETVTVVALKEAVFFSSGDIHLVAVPHDGYKISYTLSYPKSPVLRAQYFSIEINQETFKKEIAPCRTFSLYEELSILMDRGLIKGGSLDNAVVVKDDVIISKDGLVFPDEMVRHKILDLLGDLSLIGYPFHAHIIAIKSGHASNVAFAKKLNEQMESLR